MGTRRYVVRKLLHALATILFVLSFNFFLFRVMPGDPVSLLARSEKLTPADIARLETELGLDKPLAGQFVVYVRDTLQGRLGESLRSGQGVASIIGSRLWPTVLLVGLGTVFASLFRILIGIKGGWDRGGLFDTIFNSGSLVLYAMPEGWLGMLVLLFFSGVLHWFPAGGLQTGGEHGAALLVDVLDHLSLPLLTLTLGYVGQFSIVMRSSMLDTVFEDYVQTARAKGATERDVRWRHVVPNAFLPSFALIFLSFGFVLGGAVVIEAVYSWPGLGLLTYQSIQSLDYPVIEGIFLVASLAVIVANLFADLTIGYLDPRIREA